MRPAPRLPHRRRQAGAVQCLDRDGGRLATPQGEVVALHHVLQRVTQGRGPLQGDRLATHDTELEQPPLRGRPTADAQDATTLPSAELVEGHDGGRGRAPLAAAPGHGTSQGEGAREHETGAVLAILSA